MSDLDSGKKIGVWKFFWGGGYSAKGQIWTWGRKEKFGIFFGRGGVLPNVRFGLREENWSLEILGGGYSVKCQICTQGRKLEFGNLGRGDSAKGQIWTRGRKVEFGNFGGGYSAKF